MTLLIQIIIIFGFSTIGNYLSTNLGLPIPGSIIGITLLFSSLYFKIIKLSQVELVGNWLKDHMALLFIPITVGLMEKFDVIAPNLFQLTMIMVISTALTYICVAWMIEKVTREQ